MPRCAFTICGQEFPFDPHRPDKMFCNRQCSAKANALAMKGKPGKKHSARTCGRGAGSFKKGFTV